MSMSIRAVLVALCDVRARRDVLPAVTGLVSDGSLGDEVLSEPAMVAELHFA